MKKMGSHSISHMSNLKLRPKSPLPEPISKSNSSVTRAASSRGAG